MTTTDTRDILLFPLSTVLFPGGMLPLRVFEQRYIELTKTCLRDEVPFGVCLIRAGTEVGKAAVPAPVGCLAHIVQWDMPQLGLFHLQTRGGQRFRIIETRVDASELLSAQVATLPEDETGEVDPVCAGILQTILDKVGSGRFPSPVRLDDAAWVGYRLAEILPLEPEEKQTLLELAGTSERFELLRRALARLGLGT